MIVVKFLQVHFQTRSFPTEKKLSKSEHSLNVMFVDGRTYLKKIHMNLLISFNWNSWKKKKTKETKEIHIRRKILTMTKYNYFFFTQYADLSRQKTDIESCYTLLLHFKVYFYLQTHKISSVLFQKLHSQIVFCLFW